MNAAARSPLGSATIMGRAEAVAVRDRSIDREPIAATLPTPQASAGDVAPPKPANPEASAVLFRSLAEVKGQAQFLLYLADQIEDSLDQLLHEDDVCQGSFLCKVLGMYSAQLESKHQGLGDKIAETCQEVYVTVREYDATA